MKEKCNRMNRWENATPINELAQQMSDIFIYIDPDLDTRNLVFWTEPQIKYFKTNPPEEWTLWRSKLPSADQIRISSMFYIFRRRDLLTLREMKSIDPSTLGKFRGSSQKRPGIKGLGQKGQEFARIALGLE